eukprot:7932259-Pyramimonas_sp.AAC.1
MAFMRISYSTWRPNQHAPNQEPPLHGLHAHLILHLAPQSTRALKSGRFVTWGVESTLVVIGTGGP